MRPLASGRVREREVRRAYASMRRPATCRAREDPIPRLYLVIVNRNNQMYWRVKRNWRRQVQQNVNEMRRPKDKAAEEEEEAENDKA